MVTYAIDETITCLGSQLDGCDLEAFSAAEPATAGPSTPLAATRRAAAGSM